MNRDRARTTLLGLATAAALATTLAACDSTGTAAPAGGSGGRTSDAPTERPSTTPSSAPPGETGGTAASSTRCHTSQLKARLGQETHGAGQAGVAIVLTNKAGQSCTVTGFPGVSLRRDHGQAAADPVRTGSSEGTVRLRPGASAYSVLNFSNPELTGAKTVKPDEIAITPPDETDAWLGSWTSGEIPTTGLKLTALRPGTGS